jgi:hypothetical protein
MRKAEALRTHLKPQEPYLLKCTCGGAPLLLSRLVKHRPYFSPYYYEFAYICQDCLQTTKPYKKASTVLKAWNTGAFLRKRQDEKN